MLPEKDGKQNWEVHNNCTTFHTDCFNAPIYRCYFRHNSARCVQEEAANIDQVYALA